MPSSPALDILESGPVLPVAAEGAPDRLWTARSIAAGLLLGLGVAASGYLLMGGQLARQPSWLAVPLLAVVLGGVILLGQVRRWRDRRPMSVTGFVGPRPLTRADREQYGFFGREVETEHAVDKLRSPATRCLILSGESGCGKTSLLLAGVIPRLESELGCRCIYVAMDDKPVWALRQALRLAARRAVSEPGTRLKDDLEQAQRRAGRPVVLFIDQFEEFGASPVSSEDHLALIELFQCVLGGPAAALPDVQLCFSVRSDQLALLDDLSRSAGPASSAGAEARLALPPLELPAAREIIDELARRSGLRLEWPLGVVERLIEDLATEQVHFGRTRRVVHAAELQMVCQMVCHLVATRRIRTAADYPGKQQLLTAYLGRSIRSVPGLSPARVLDLLLHL
ncbi:MAG TPA: ATP-binding protein, partial [Pseudomonadota bacterium]|nr:ATP-binding protein [Pseudomonadota bacterium]